jgi:hypothetical protein
MTTQPLCDSEGSPNLPVYRCALMRDGEAGDEYLCELETPRRRIYPDLPQRQDSDPESGD